METPSLDDDRTNSQPKHSHSSFKPRAKVNISRLDTRSIPSFVRGEECVTSMSWLDPNNTDPVLFHSLDCSLLGRVDNTDFLLDSRSFDRIFSFPPSRPSQTPTSFSHSPSLSSGFPMERTSSSNTPDHCSPTSFNHDTEITSTWHNGMNETVNAQGGPDIFELEHNFQHAYAMGVPPYSMLNYSSPLLQMEDEDAHMEDVQRSIDSSHYFTLPPGSPYTSPYTNIPYIEDIQNPVRSSCSVEDMASLAQAGLPMPVATETATTPDASTTDISIQSFDCPGSPSLSQKSQSLPSGSQPRRSRTSTRAKVNKRAIGELRVTPASVGKMRSRSTNQWISPAQTSPTLQCSQCKKSFNDAVSLQKHNKTEHIRPLICVFNWAGCTSRFASKNEWKRHVVSQHLALRYWICTEGPCGESNRSKSSARRRSAASLPTTGCIFNRKDLYTQHIRRMHVAKAYPNAQLTRRGKSSPRSSKTENASPPSSSDKYLQDLQARAARTRCELPTFMLCPAAGCKEEFHGQSAWDDRMEHVATHLDQAKTGDELPIVFGGTNDWTLTNWAEQDGVKIVRRISAGGWRLGNPLRGDYEDEEDEAAVPACSNSDPQLQSEIVVQVLEEEEEDAEGEDYSPW